MLYSLAITCGSGLARDGSASDNIYIDGPTAIAGQLPQWTGYT
ncbi:hypothetical protein HNR03_005121 [Pseudomonas sp. JAI111]|nr:hypothetical protein [Pseudomonas sp. JAI111]